MTSTHAVHACMVHTRIVNISFLKKHYKANPRLYSLHLVYLECVSLNCVSPCIIMAFDSQECLHFGLFAPGAKQGLQIAVRGCVFRSLGLSGSAPSAMP